MFQISPPPLCQGKTSPYSFPSKLPSPSGAFVFWLPNWFLHLVGFLKLAAMTGRCKSFHFSVEQLRSIDLALPVTNVRKFVKLFLLFLPKFESSATPILNFLKFHNRLVPIAKHLLIISEKYPRVRDFEE